MATAETLTYTHVSMLDKLEKSLRKLFLIAATLITFAVGMVLIVLLSILTLGRAQNWIVETFSRTIGRTVLWFAGVKLKIEHVGEQVKGPAIYLSNHSSTLDIFIIIALGLPRVRYVAKYELLFNPLIAVMGLITGQIFIKRQDSARAVATINRAYARIRKQKLSLFVAPEGTRIEGGRIGQFKKGAFRMAIDLQCPIVPMHFAGARKLCPGKTMEVKPGTVFARIYPPVDTSGWTLENLDGHVARIQQQYVTWEQEFENATAGKWQG